MRRSGMLLLALVAVLGFSGAANAALTTIGTATYLGNDYNVIYEGELGGSGLVWLDYTHGLANWQGQRDWATGLNASGVLAYNLNPGLNLTWGGDWRLPSTVDGLYVYGYDGTTTAGYNITTSEMGHLYYASLMNKGYMATDGTFPQPGWGLTNTGPFNNLQANSYWSGTEYTLSPSSAWASLFYIGYQDFSDKYGDFFALAVRPGEVSAVPLPASVLFLASGLIGLVGFRRKFRK